MKVCHLSAARSGWLGALASLLDRLQDNDFLVLSDDAMCELARNALERQDYKHIRIMTEEVYSDLQKSSGEDLEALAEQGE